MNRRLAFAAVAAAVLSLPIGLVAWGQEKAPAAAGDFLEVGQRYSFAFSGDVHQDAFSYEVLAKPSGGWVKVRMLDVSRPSVQWFNLNLVKRIYPKDKDNAPAK